MTEDSTKDLMTVLEDVCPKCEGDLRTTRIGGIDSFLLMHGFIEADGTPVITKDGSEINVWEPSVDEFGDVGSFEYACVTDPEHKFAVFQGSGGDWVLG